MTALHEPVAWSMAGEDLAADLAAAHRTIAAVWGRLDRAQTDLAQTTEWFVAEVEWRRRQRVILALQRYAHRRYLAPPPVDGRLHGVGVEDRGRWLPPFVPAEPQNDGAGGSGP